MSLKAVILVGGAQKGTRFRPLSEYPKALFHIAGVPLIEQHIDQLSKVKNLEEIVLLGFFKADEFNDFRVAAEDKYKIRIKYYQEQESLGTCGGLLSFKNQLLENNPEAIFVLNADICGDLPVQEMVEELNKKRDKECLILTTEATREQSTNYGCAVFNANDDIVHYVEKPITFISCRISCGLYLFRPTIFNLINEIQKNSLTKQLWLETDVFPELASNKLLCGLHNTTRWWSQIKTGGSVLYGNRNFLKMYLKTHPEKLATTKKHGCTIIGDVYIDSSAQVHPTAKIGPNVSIGAGVVVSAGVRIREAIVLAESVIEEHACVLHSIIGWKSKIGAYARIEGIPTEPNPNIPFAKLDNTNLFNNDGRLNPSLTIFGSGVTVDRETLIYNCVVLPFKELNVSSKNQIIFKLTLNELDDYRRIFERLKASRINFQNPEDAIKKGTFGSVFRFANCKEELVVKYYRSENKCSQYTREEMIYLDPNLRHSFLIEYRAAIQSKTGKFIFAKYYPGGDVLEYIREHTISLKRCVGWMLNVVNGLDYLHLQRYAHRDLKLSNLFIKDNDEIVIGDFGLSIHDQKITEKVEVVGTLRYRSPDLLTQSENHINTFTDFINQDIYALGLVFSELLQRTYFDRDADGTVQEDENTAHEGVPVYKQLFFEELGAEPTLTTMREAISKKLIQPKFPDHLKGTDLGDIFEKMLLKMWEHVSLRPTSKYVKDKIKSYSERHYEF
uniref:Protein kinase domain-containing protein n=1 Tax=Rhabditophanes sp. KR3021 TaxID=114890 RepID=A0AC35UB79_9BILA